MTSKQHMDSTGGGSFLIRANLDNMDVIKEFRTAFLEKYLEKNKLGRKLKTPSTNRRNAIRRLSSLEKEKNVVVVVGENEKRLTKSSSMRIQHAISGFEPISK